MLPAFKVTFILIFNTINFYLFPDFMWIGFYSMYLFVVDFLLNIVTVRLSYDVACSSRLFFFITV